MRKKFFIFVSFIMCAFTMPGIATQKVFYTLRGEHINDVPTVSKLIQTIGQYHKKIDIIISQAYQLDENGTLWGMVNPHLEKTLRKYDIKLMPMVTNANYNVKNTVRFLQNEKAQRQAISSLVAICKEKQFYGIQLDFEALPITVRDSFTEFYIALAKALHANGFKISIALFPRTQLIPQTNIQKAVYNNWGGAYNYKALGNASDFVSVMAYDQHSGSTTPGPNAGIPWVTAVINYTLKYIPASKVLLGIPSYSIYWQTKAYNKIPQAEGVGVSYETIQNILVKYNA